MLTHTHTLLYTYTHHYIANKICKRITILYAGYPFNTPIEPATYIITLTSPSGLHQLQTGHSSTDQHQTQYHTQQPNNNASDIQTLHFAKDYVANTLAGMQQ